MRCNGWQVALNDLGEKESGRYIYLLAVHGLELFCVANLFLHRILTFPHWYNVNIIVSWGCAGQIYISVSRKWNWD